MNVFRESHVIDRQVVRACEVQRPKGKVYSSNKYEGDNGNGTEASGKDGHDSSKSMCGEMKMIEEKRSISIHHSLHESIDGAQAKEGNGMKSRRGILGGLNGMRRPNGSLFHNSSPMSSPADGGMSSHSSHSPCSTSHPLSPLSSSSRRSTEIIREFVERISKRILSMGRERDDGIEIAWFCDRETEKDVWKKDENKEKKVEDVVKVTGDESGECDSGWRGGVRTKKEGQARWRVVITERPNEGGSTVPVECAGNEQSEKMKEEKEERGESFETTETVGEGTKWYEELDESGQHEETVVVLSEENQEVLEISMGIAVKAMKFGGIREDSIVVIV